VGELGVGFSSPEAEGALQHRTLRRGVVEGAGLREQLLEGLRVDVATAKLVAGRRSDQQLGADDPAKAADRSAKGPLRVTKPVGQQLRAQHRTGLGDKLAQQTALLGARESELGGDKGYLDLVTKAPAFFVGALEDSMGEVVAAAGDPNFAGKYASVVTAQVADGQIAASMGRAVDILNHVTGVTGVGGTLVRGLYGPWATLAWIGLYDSLDQLDAAGVAQSADMAYVAMLDKGGNLVVDGSAGQVLFERIS
jgi:hypothetical protein